MTMLVVDLLEAVQVEHQHAQRMAVALGARYFACQSLLAEAAVGKRRERIARGQTMKFFRADFQSRKQSQMLGRLGAQTLDLPLLIYRVNIEEQNQAHQSMNRQTDVELKYLIGIPEYAGQGNGNHGKRQEQHHGNRGPPQPPV